MLVGRSAECGALDRLLEGGREGRSGALVLRGEPGVGKTALLGYAAERATGARVLRATGIESESELAFAALHQLVGRERDRLDRLPEPQAAALRGALGLAPAQGGDPFLTSLAVLSLLADLAEETPVLCLVDDAQWLDEPSAAALLFTARRIEAEGIVMLFTVREGEERGFEALGVPSLVVGGLDEEAARELLGQRLGNGLAPEVRERILAETAGNALALVEVPTALTEPQLRGDEPLAHPLPVAASLEAAYVTRLRRLPEETQSLLLFAAAEDSGELAAILRASASKALDESALEPAERDRLVSVNDGRLVFRHPLVRSAIYQGRLSASASLSTRRSRRHRTSRTVTGAPGIALQPPMVPMRRLHAVSKPRRSVPLRVAAMPLPARPSRRQRISALTIGIAQRDYWPLPTPRGWPDRPSAHVLSSRRPDTLPRTISRSR